MAQAVCTTWDCSGRSWEYTCNHLKHSPLPYTLLSELVTDSASANLHDRMLPAVRGCPLGSIRVPVQHNLSVLCHDLLHCALLLYEESLKTGRTLS